MIPFLHGLVPERATLTGGALPIYIGLRLVAQRCMVAIALLDLIPAMESNNPLALLADLNGGFF